MDDINELPEIPSQSHYHRSSPSTTTGSVKRNGLHQVNHISDSGHHHPPQARIAELQEEYLIPMKEDLSDWLKAILPIEDLDANNFMSRLDNGVVVCKLAKLIEEKCDIDGTKLAPPESANNNNNIMTGSNKLSNNNYYSENHNNNINNLKNNLNTSDDTTITNNNNNNRSNSTYNNNYRFNSGSPSHGDQGQYRSNSFSHSNGRRFSFNQIGSLNGHSNLHGSSTTPSSPSPSFSSSNGICARTMKCWENAKSETFYARDNVSNFIKWCRKLNVRECVLFESEDLVLHNNPKNVVLCVLEVARIACKKFLFTPAPGLVQFEQEIDAEEKAELERERLLRRKKRLQSKQSTGSLTKSVNTNSSSTPINNNKDDNNVLVGKVDSNETVNPSNENSLKNNLNSVNNGNGDELGNNNDNNNNNSDDHGDHLTILDYGDDNNNKNNETESGNGSSENLDQPRPGSDETIGGQSSDSGSVNTGDDGVDGWSSVSQENLGRASSVTSISSTSADSTGTSSQAPFGQESEKVVSQLDQKVMLIAKSYYGKKAKHGIQRLAEGKYRIAGKIVFVRLLKDRHVMVRVGGGWDTLQHFLERHGNGSDPVKDISPSDLLPMDTRPSESMSRRRNSQSSQTQSQSSQQQQSSVPSTPILRRCLSSTPVSRSSLSSPEPWTASSTTATSGLLSTKGNESPYCAQAYNNLINGYSPYGHRSLARRSSACTTLSNITTASSSTTHSSTSSSSSTNLNSTEKDRVSPISTKSIYTLSRHSSSSNIARRRSLASETLINTLTNHSNNQRNTSTTKPNRSMLSLNLTRSPSTSSYLNSSFSSSKPFNTSSGNLNNLISTVTPTKTTRYPNYLQSSQHITSKSSSKSPLTTSSSSASATMVTP